MITDLSFITNEKNQSLKDRFEVLIKDTSFFDCLVGYFYTSGFHALYRSLEKTEKIRILIGISTNRQTYGLLDKAGSGDRNFYAITAERYIMDYLKSRNPNLVDNDSKQGGTDGILHCGNEDIGIEVTTVNGFIADAIFIERMLLFFKEKGYALSRTCEISYNYERLNGEIKKRGNTAFYDYIEKVGCNIIRRASNELEQLNVIWKVTNRKTGGIVWERNAADKFPILEHLTCRLISALKRNKSTQLSRMQKNLIFIGANHCGPENWLNPRIFQEMAHGEILCQCQIDYIQDYLSKNLPENVLGLCYYIYSLEQKGPSYNPLRMFWRDPNDRIHINL